MPFDLILKGDTAAALKRAGAQRVWVGAESGSQIFQESQRNRGLAPLLNIGHETPTLIPTPPRHRRRVDGRCRILSFQEYEA